MTKFFQLFLLIILWRIVFPLLETFLGILGHQLAEVGHFFFQRHRAPTDFAFFDVLTGETLEDYFVRHPSFGGKAFSFLNDQSHNDIGSVELMEGKYDPFILVGLFFQSKVLQLVIFAL
jgi:hypothetical protein